MSRPGRIAGSEGARVLNAVSGEQASTSTAELIARPETRMRRVIIVIRLNRAIMDAAQTVTKAPPNRIRRWASLTAGAGGAYSRAMTLRRLFVTRIYEASLATA